MSKQTRHQLYKLIVTANSDNDLRQTWNVEKFIDEVEKIYGEDTE